MQALSEASQNISETRTEKIFKEHKSIGNQKYDFRSWKAEQVVMTLTPEKAETSISLNEKQRHLVYSTCHIYIHSKRTLNSLEKWLIVVLRQHKQKMG